MSETKFHEVSEDTKEVFDRIVDKQALPFNIKFHLLSNETQKCLIKINKVSDMYQYITKYDMIVIFNEIYLTALDELSCEILIQQELDRMQCDIQSGKIKMAKPELSTSVGVIKKYGIDDVAKANQLEELYKQQKEDDQLDPVTERTNADGATEFFS